MLGTVSFDAREFLVSWRRLESEIDSFGFQAWRRALKEGKETMHELGYQNKTGELTASMYSLESVTGRFQWSGEMGATAEHALYIDKGTRDHGPVRCRFLHWINDHGSHVYAKWVRGIKPSRLLDTATRRFLVNVERYVARAIDSANR